MGGIISVLIEVVFELLKLALEGIGLFVKAFASTVSGPPVPRVSRTSSSLIARRNEYVRTQEALPKLHVPSLKQTTEKFLQTARPILTEAEFKQAQLLVADTLKPESAARKLQFLLQERSFELENWLSDWWKNVAYLDYRMPICVHVSPGIYMPLNDYKGERSQIQAAAKAITGVLAYKKTLDNYELAPEKMAGQPICMYQYYQMLGTCRIPGEKADTVLSYQKNHPEAPNHITVIRNNNFFSVPVYGAGGQPLSTNQIIEQLSQVVSQSSKQAPAVGILTSDHRDHWFKAYNTMCKDSKNKENFNDIQRSICVVCLDKSLPADNRLDVTTAYMMQGHNGGGSNSNTPNRWFDKTLQILVGPDGFVSGTSEHTTAEGPPIVAILDFIINNYIKKGIEPEQKAAADVKQPNRLDFTVSPEVSDMIKSSEVAADATINDLDMLTFMFPDFGKNFIKSQKMSPDAFLQVAFQLAFYKLNGHSTATYESGSLRKFKKGRTDTIRSCSIASHAYCKAMQDAGAPASEKVAKLRAAIASHRAYTDEVINGNGIDRHFLGLRLMAKEMGMEMPKILEDPIFEKTNTWKISTSQVVSQAGGVLCFGPVVQDGYGICYNPMNDSVFFAFSAWKSCPTTSAKELKQAIVESLKEAKAILLQAGQSKA